MAEEVKQRSSELIQLKRKIKLAQSGHKLLKKKRDGLILEFFEILKTAKDVRRGLSQKYLACRDRMLTAVALDGIVELRSLALALQERPAVDLEVKNIMGVTVPKIRRATARKSFYERGYGLLSTSLRVEQMANAYEELLEDIISAAEIETTLRKLLNEIEKTKRRVNALEFVVIPRLCSQASFISLRLEEMERENVFRMKRIKAKAAA